MNLTEKKLTAKARKALPKESFVFKKERRYPIQDKAHARNALARVSQHGTPAEKARVKSAVKRKFPKIDVKENSEPGRFFEFDNRNAGYVVDSLLSSR